MAGGEDFGDAALRWAHVAPLGDRWLILVIAVPAVVLGWWWPHWSTIVHEMGHVLATIVFGGRVSGIRLHANMGGETRSRQRALPNLISLMSGYAAPPLIGWGLATLYDRSLSGAAVAALAALFLLALLLLRSLFGLVSIGSALAVLAVSIAASPVMQAGVTIGFAAALLAGGARGIWMGWKVRSDAGRPDGTECDAGQLRRILRVTPQGFWLALWSGLWVFCLYRAACEIATAV